MKKNTKGMLALLLACLLCVASIGFLTVAEEAGETPAEGETDSPATLTPETIPNDLILDVNFNGDERFAPAVLKQVGGAVHVSADGDSIVLETVKTSSRTAIHTLYWGGTVGNLPMGSDYSYTITFAVTNTSDYQFGFLVDYDGSDAANSNGFKGTPSAMNTVTVGNADDVNGKRYYCIEVDGKGGSLNFYVLYGGEYRLVTTATYANGSPLSDKLALILYLYGGRNITAAEGTLLSTVTVSDLNVYSGLYRGLALYDFTPETDGSLLLEVKDLAKDAFNPITGAGYRQTVASMSSGDYNTGFYSYNEATGLMQTALIGQSKSYSIVYGGETNLTLDENSKYTVSYMQTLTKAGGAGLRISYGGKYSSSIGFYTPNGGTNACLAWGANTSPGYSGYKSFTAGMTQASSVYWQEGGFVKVDIEIDGTVVSIYINDVLLLSEDITNPSNTAAKEDIEKQYMSDTLSLVFHEYATADQTDGALSTQITAIRVYSGLTHQEVYDVKALSMQVGTVADGRQTVRFTGGGMNGDYNRVGFEITAVYGENSDLYNYSTPETYRKLTSPRADASIAELIAADTGMEYLYGYTLSGIPADITVTFTVRPYVIYQGNTLYGEAVSFTLENGALK